MLVLERRAGQRVRIGDDVELEVIECGRGRVRVAIRAPKSVAIRREELVKEAPPAPRRRGGREQ
ncbi:carbon storage regulator [Halorhodospira halophila]|uniref:carbon storage regulator n=1 Tax=Halorhodospira halophila TaxID=1053 RepID=UPI001911C686|nr:carbon storage regulator [Halorhodospira halophila]MBK5944741.1 hypothetical protein [Halorhodospira halophila]